jgi:hypothetical protein
MVLFKKISAPLKFLQDPAFWILEGVTSASVRANT